MEVNIAALEPRTPDGPVLARYARVGEALAGRAFATGAQARAAAIATLHDLVAA
jgi:hypothetical protein